MWGWSGEGEVGIGCGDIGDSRPYLILLWIRAVENFKILWIVELQ